MNNSVWLDGGHEASLNMSGSWTGNYTYEYTLGEFSLLTPDFLATNLTQINFNVNFTIPDSFSAAQLFKPPEVMDLRGKSLSSLGKDDGGDKTLVYCWNNVVHQ